MYHHSSPSTSKLPAMTSSHALQDPEDDDTPLFQIMNKPAEITVVELPPEKKQKKPSLMKRASSVKGALKRLVKPGTDDTPSLPDEPRAAMLAPNVNASVHGLDSTRGSMLPVAAGRVRAAAVSSNGHMIGGGSPQIPKAPERARKKLIRDGEAKYLNLGPQAGSSKLPLSAPQTPHNKQSHANLRGGFAQTSQTSLGLSSKSHASLRGGLQQTDQTLTESSPLPVTDAQHGFGVWPYSPKQDALSNGKMMSDDTRLKTRREISATVPDRLQQYVTRDKFPLVRNTTEGTAPQLSHYSSSTSELYGSSQSPQLQGSKSGSALSQADVIKMHSSAATRNHEISRSKVQGLLAMSEAARADDRRRQLSTSPGTSQYISKTLLSGEGLRRLSSITEAMPPPSPQGLRSVSAASQADDTRRNSSPTMKHYISAPLLSGDDLRRASPALQVMPPPTPQETHFVDPPSQLAHDAMRHSSSAMRHYISTPLLGGEGLQQPSPAPRTMAALPLAQETLFAEPAGQVAYGTTGHIPLAMRHYTTTPLLTAEGLRRPSPGPQATPPPPRALRHASTPLLTGEALRQPSPASQVMPHYPSTPLLASEGLRQPSPAPKPMHKLQRPKQLRDRPVQASTPPQQSAMKKPALVPVYSHSKNIQFHDAPKPKPEVAPLVHTTSTPMLRVPSPRPTLQHRSASALVQPAAPGYDVHSAVMENAQRHPSIDAVLRNSSSHSALGGSPDRNSFTRSERGVPGEARRPGSPLPDIAAIARQAQPASPNGAATFRSDAYFSTRSCQPLESSQQARPNTYPQASSSRVHQLAPTLSVPNLRDRRGSITDVDYGRLGGNGITNKLSVVAPSASKPSTRTSSLSARIDSAVDSLKDVFALPAHDFAIKRKPCPPHAEGCKCGYCYEQRARRFYKSCRVRKRIAELASTCQRLEKTAACRPLDEQATAVREDIKEFWRIKNLADWLAVTPPPSEGHPFHKMDGCDEEHRLNGLTRMISVWERNVNEAELMLQASADEDVEVQPQLARVATRVWSSQKRYRHYAREPEPAIPEESGEDTEVVVTKGKNVARNF